MSSISIHVPNSLINEAELQTLIDQRAASRLRDADGTLWGESARAEASQRLGWVAAALHVTEVVEQAETLKAELAHIDYDRVILCGMGGSSLSPQVMTASSTVPLIALDSIHPDALNEHCSSDDLKEALVIVSSKSGGTSETRTQLALCEKRLKQAGIKAKHRIIVITDPGSELEEYARLRGYRTVLGHPNVGGRYSALTVFGLVPAMLAGGDLSNIAEDVTATIRLLSEDHATNPALKLAVALHHAAVTTGTAQFTTSDIPGLPAWIEQLVAESTGKDGKGLLPIPRELGQTTHTGGLHIHLASGESQDNEITDVRVYGRLGAQFFFWEYVTSLLCVLMDVNPFDQPDVERTKRAARMMKPGEPLVKRETVIVPGCSVVAGASFESPETINDFISQLLGTVQEADYFVIQAFTSQMSSELTTISALIERFTGVPCTVSYGPQYLHSTGQLHKGGRPNGVFLNIFEAPQADITVPGTITTFGWLCQASALADQQVLRGLGRNVTGMRIETAEVLKQLLKHLSEAVTPVKNRLK